MFDQTLVQMAPPHANALPAHADPPSATEKIPWIRHPVLQQLTIPYQKAMKRQDGGTDAQLLIIQQCPNTVLEEWDAKSKKQSITCGKDIPALKEDLLRYDPHEHQNGRLTANLCPVSKGSKMEYHY
eukprot:5319752-Ditylum_brightwellii.AAC.2